MEVVPAGSGLVVAVVVAVGGACSDVGYFGCCYYYRYHHWKVVVITAMVAYHLRSLLSLHHLHDSCVAAAGVATVHPVAAHHPVAIDFPANAVVVLAAVFDPSTSLIACASGARVAYAVPPTSGHGPQSVQPLASYHVIQYKLIIKYS